METAGSELEGPARHRRSRPALRVVALGLLVLAAFSVRWFWEPEYRRRGPDASEYLGLAESLYRSGTYSLDSEPPREPSSWRVPLFPAVLATGWLATGPSYSAALGIQAVLGALSVLAIFGFTRRLYGEPAAWWAAALLAFYPPHIVLSSVVLSEVLYGFWLLLGLLLILKALRTPPATVPLLAAGGVFALATLTRTEGFFYPFALSLLLLLLPRARRPRPAQVASFLLVYLLGCGVWMARNVAVSGDFGLVHPVLPYRGLIGGLDLPHSDPLVNGYYRFRDHDDPAALEAYQEEVTRTYLDFVRERPATFVAVRARQLVRFWIDSLSARSLHGEPEERRVRVAGDLAFGVLPLLWILVELARRPPYRLEALLVLSYPLYITLVVLPLEADYRYSIPARVVLLSLLAASLAGSRRRPDPAPPEPSPQLLAQARRRLETERVALFLAGSEGASPTDELVALAGRVDPELRRRMAEIYAIVDGPGETSPETRAREEPESTGLHLYRTPFPRGPGGLRKLGLLYGLRAGYDTVIVLDAQGHEPPEALPLLLAAADEDAEAVFAVREPLAPPWRRWGAAGLHALLRFLWSPPARDVLGGPRLYRRRALERVPFVENTDRSHFDFELAVQARATRWSIREVEVPVSGPPVSLRADLTFAAGTLKTLLRYYLVQLGIFSRRKYDFLLFEDDRYHFKASPVSLHQHILSRPEIRRAASTVELGANRGLLSAEIARQVPRHVAVDLVEPDRAGRAEARKLDLDTDFAAAFEGETFECALGLDVIEHLDRPEEFLQQVTRLLRPGGTLLLSTANVAYLPMRLSLLLGQFNYGKRGILDRTHKRLFTVGSFTKLLDQYGYDVLEVRGFAPPLTDLVSGKLYFLEALHARLSRRMPRWFGYNFLITARRRDTVEEIFQSTTGPTDPDRGGPRGEPPR